MNAMNSNALYYAGLRARLSLSRIGWNTGIACLLSIIGAASLLWYVPHLRTQGEAQQRALLRTQQSLRSSESTEQAAPPSITEERMAKFYDALGDKRYVEQQIKTLFGIASKTGLSLNQAEYKFAFDKNSNTYTYQIQLPVKGSYLAIRQFCEQTLRAIPFASLDEMNFKRESIGSPALEAKLRFTLYLAAAPTAQEKSGVQQ